MIMTLLPGDRALPSIALCTLLGALACSSEDGPSGHDAGMFDNAPDPTGAGAEAAMRGALADAGLAPDAIAYLNLHGTGTPLNDAMEGQAVDRVFGASLPVSSTKPLVGHTLGAAGALEAAFCWLMLDRCDGQVLELPPHCWDGEQDPEIPPLHLVGKGESAPASGALRVMTNSFGFGGNNCTLILERSL